MAMVRPSRTMMQRSQSAPFPMNEADDPNTRTSRGKRVVGKRVVGKRVVVVQQSDSNDKSKPDNIMDRSRLIRELYSGSFNGQSCNQDEQHREGGGGGGAAEDFADDRDCLTIATMPNKPSNLRRSRSWFWGGGIPAAENTNKFTREESNNNSNSNDDDGAKPKRRGALRTFKSLSVKSLGGRTTSSKKQQEQTLMTSPAGKSKSSRRLFGPRRISKNNEERLSVPEDRPVCFDPPSLRRQQTAPATRCPNPGTLKDDHAATTAFHRHQQPVLRRSRTASSAAVTAVIRSAAARKQRNELLPIPSTAAETIYAPKSGTPPLPSRCPPPPGKLIRRNSFLVRLFRRKRGFTPKLPIDGGTAQTAEDAGVFASATTIFKSDKDEDPSTASSEEEDDDDDDEFDEELIASNHSDDDDDIYFDSAGYEEKKSRFGTEDPYRRGNASVNVDRWSPILVPDMAALNSAPVRQPVRFLDDENSGQYHRGEEEEAKESSSSNNYHCHLRLDEESEGDDDSSELSLLSGVIATWVAERDAKLVQQQETGEAKKGRNCGRLKGCLKSTSSSMDCGNDNNNKKKKPRLSVVFDKVHIREYARTVGDHPNCQCGPPVALGWHYLPARDCALYDYERIVKPIKRDKREFYLPTDQRKRMLLQEWGHTPEDLAKACREVTFIQYSREKAARCREPLQFLLEQKREADRLQQQQQQQVTHQHQCGTTIQSQKQKEEDIWDEVPATDHGTASNNASCRQQPLLLTRQRSNSPDLSDTSQPRMSLRPPSPLQPISREPSIEVPPNPTDDEHRPIEQEEEEDDDEEDDDEEDDELPTLFKVTDSGSSYQNLSFSHEKQEQQLRTVVPQQCPRPQRQQSAPVVSVTASCCVGGGGAGSGSLIKPADLHRLSSDYGHFTPVVIECNYDTRTTPSAAFKSG